MSKWAQPSDEERLKAFLAKQQSVDVQPAYYRTGDIDTGASSRMETGAEYRSSSGKTTGVAETQTCFSCKTQQPKGAKFCAGCGSKMGPPPAAAGNNCTGCGFSNTAGAKFCAGCGKNLSAAAPPTCKCGVLKTNAKFCSECGDKWN
eukprot:TRINITY_DN10599_c0_g1_i1.p1 TRINITY_DN10599_c0_g1~~TRINITY_DN10599_c0_g1_i1.p1  ORF type:complete len:147 (-),score=34.98 TRINITY_DN10599_c0_g1_i1:62-502(-)